MYNFAHVWTPEKSLIRERYASVLGHTPRVLFGISQSWQPLLHVIRHASEVCSVAFSPDGGRLASGSDEIVRIWNTATGELEDELEGHTKPVWSVAFSHNGRFIVSGSDDETVRIWNAATCETRYMLTGHISYVRSVAISRNDKFVVSGSNDRIVRIWDTVTGELLRELKGHAKQVMSVAVSPDCQHIASGSSGEAWIWTKDGVLEHKLDCPIEAYNILHDLAFSHDGRRILCNINRTEWTVTMGHHLSPPDTDHDPHMRDITSTAYSPDDSEIVCGMKDGTVLVWNTETKRHILGQHSGRVNSVSFSPDGSRTASGSSDGVRIWNPRLKGTIEKEVHSPWIYVALSHDGRWIVTASLRHVQVWRVRSETMTKANKLNVKANVWSIALSHDGSRIVIGCEDGSIRVWNHLTNATKRLISGPPDHAWTVFWNYLISGRPDHAWAVFWNYLTKRQTRGHSDWVRSVAFSYDGNYVVSGSWDKTVRIWDRHTGNEVGLYHHRNWVRYVAFSRDGRRVAFGDDDDAVWIWNPSTGEILSEPENKLERGWVYSVAFSHDGNHVISGWYDTVWIWNVTTNTSTKLSEPIQLPDGTRVHPLTKGYYHIYDPVDQANTNGIPPYILSTSPDHDWITGEQEEHDCWIHPHYRDFSVHIAKSIVCLQTRRDMIVLDLKSTQRAERVMPRV